VKGDQTLWCWGANFSGQLGVGTTMSSSTVPIQVTGTGFAQVSGGYLHACAIKQDGTLWCWGTNASLQLGAPTVAMLYEPGQVQGSDWKQVVTGASHTCAIKMDGSLWCWGGNDSGQLGNTSIATDLNAKTSVPAPIAGTWMNVTAGRSHTCGVMSDQSLWCWGNNTDGQLGISSSTSQSTPVAVMVPGRAWAAVSAGQSHTCALATDGSLWCWGNNVGGQLGIGSYDKRQEPTQVVQ
jgi:alpha-tubulin suppressor-like RCC1 family protein